MARDFIEGQIGEQTSPLTGNTELRAHACRNQPALGAAAGLGTGFPSGLSCRFDQEM